MFKSLCFVVAIAASQQASANGVFNGPVTGGSLTPNEAGKEMSLNDLLTKERSCVEDSYAEIFQQIYPELQGPFGYQTAEIGKIDTNSTALSDLGVYFYERNGIKYTQNLKFIGNFPYPNISGGERTQLSFTSNGQVFAQVGIEKPNKNLDGTLIIGQFGGNDGINLITKFPGYKFDVSKVVDSYDFLGRPVNARYVVKNLKLVRGGAIGTQVPFENIVTGQKTNITWNADAFAQCLSSEGVPN